MKAELKTDWTVGKLIKMSEQKAISINHEYQRGGCVETSSNANAD